MCTQSEGVCGYDAPLTMVTYPIVSVHLSRPANQSGGRDEVPALPC